MKRRKRFFQRDILNHCYQRSADNGVIFYTLRDYLVWFTIMCCAARQFDIQVLAACPMPDHVHLSLVAKKATRLSSFMSVYSQNFALEYNRAGRMKGSLFKHPFGSAPKYGAKKARTNLIYVGNNVVERQLASKAEDSRWSFVAYAVSNHPFSESIDSRKARRPLLRAIKEVQACRKQNKPLTYNQLQRIFNPLEAKEKQQLTDYIISQYNAIDYPAALAFFDNSYENYLTALHSTTGSEYDLNEVFVGKTDKPYAQMSRILLEEKGYADIHEILSLSKQEKYDLFLLLRKRTSVMGTQIARFLHLPLVKADTSLDYAE